MDDIDEARLEQLLALMGHDRLVALACALADGLGVLATVSDGELADHLHRLKGSAASLGFTALAAMLADAEAGACAVEHLVASARSVMPRMEAALHGLNRQR